MPEDRSPNSRSNRSKSKNRNGMRRGGRGRFGQKGLLSASQGSDSKDNDEDKQDQETKDAEEEQVKVNAQTRAGIRSSAISANGYVGSHPAKERNSLNKEEPNRNQRQQQSQAVLLNRAAQVQQQKQAVISHAEERKATERNAITQRDSQNRAILNAPEGDVTKLAAAQVMADNQAKFPTRSLPQSLANHPAQEELRQTGKIESDPQAQQAYDKWRQKNNIPQNQHRGKRRTSAMNMNRFKLGNPIVERYLSESNLARQKLSWASAPKRGPSPLGKGIIDIATDPQNIAEITAVALEQAKSLPDYVNKFGGNVGKLLSGLPIVRGGYKGYKSIEDRDSFGMGMAKVVNGAGKLVDNTAVSLVGGALGTAATTSVGGMVASILAEKAYDVSPANKVTDNFLDKIMPLQALQYDMIYQLLRDPTLQNLRTNGR